MNRIFPEYTELTSSFDEEIYYDERRKLRLHVTRYTDYGERYKMFAFLVEPKTKTSVLKLTGIELEKNSNENYEVVNLEFMGSGEKKGIDFYDEITRLEISSLDRPPKEIIYIFGLFILALVIFSQRRRINIKKRNSSIKIN